MSLSTFRIGSPRRRGEGLRIAAVRYLPRGVKKTDYAQRDLFDLWLPLLAPSAALFRSARGRSPEERKRSGYLARYAREMGSTDARQTIRLLAALARRSRVAVGCYCEDESACHRSVLRELILEAQRSGEARVGAALLWKGQE